MSTEVCASVSLSSQSHSGLFGASHIRVASTM
jgi:hypothetical protein